MHLIAVLLLLRLSLAWSGDDALFSAEDLDQIRQRIIRSLGLASVPDISEVNVTEEERAEAYRIYFAKLKEKEEGRNDEKNDEEEEKILILKAIGSSLKQDTKNSFPLQLQFPINTLQDIADFIPRKSILRIFKKCQNLPDHRLRLRMRAHSFVTFRIYQLLTNDSSDKIFVTSHRVFLKNAEWESIAVNVTYITNSNIELYIECDECNTYGLSISLPENNRNFKGPTLDVTLSSTSLIRSKRSVRHRKKKRKSLAEIYDRSTWSGATDCTKNSKKKCCRNRMYVNFTHLRMDFVVEPKGFEAYYCKGKCPWLYNPAHAHALIQSTMNARGADSSIPKPCCAPSKLSNLTIMHYDENKKLKVTDWTNAVVEECACS